MEKHEIRPLHINEDRRQNLPVTYNYIVFNELTNLDVHYMPRYSDRLTSYVGDIHPPKLISKIIDFSNTKDLEV